MTIGRSLVHWLRHDGGAQSIATIPLDTFPKPASDTIIAIFAIWGQSQLLICPVYLVILWRYNSLIPFMCLLILADWGLRLHFSRFSHKKVVTRGVPPGKIGNYIVTPLAAILFYYSLPY